MVLLRYYCLIRIIHFWVQSLLGEVAQSRVHGLSGEEDQGRIIGITHSEVQGLPGKMVQGPRFFQDKTTKGPRIGRG